MDSSRKLPVEGDWVASKQRESWPPTYEALVNSLPNRALHVDSYVRSNIFNIKHTVNALEPSSLRKTVVMSICVIFTRNGLALSDHPCPL